jgi:hypothetical protein
MRDRATLVPEINSSGDCTSHEVEIDQQIQERLQKSFADSLSEPIPDRFIELLDRLAREMKSRE